MPRLIIRETDLMLIEYFQFHDFHVNSLTRAFYRMFFKLIVNGTNIGIGKQSFNFRFITLDSKICNLMARKIFGAKII